MARLDSLHIELCGRWYCSVARLDRLQTKGAVWEVVVLSSAPRQLTHTAGGVVKWVM